MESLKELYKIGNGPSSSHTMGPKKAAERFAERSRDVDSYRVTLYGSLAATGKGHLTDVAILSVLEPIAPTQIVWEPKVVLPFHPNGMLFEGLKAGKVVDSWTIYSIGPGEREFAPGDTRQHLSADDDLGDQGLVLPRRQNLLGVCQRLRRPRNMGLPRPDMDGDVRNDPARPEQRRRTARRA